MVSTIILSMSRVHDSHHHLIPVRDDLPLCREQTSADYKDVVRNARHLRNHPKNVVLMHHVTKDFILIVWPLEQSELESRSMASSGTFAA